MKLHQTMLAVVAALMTMSVSAPAWAVSVVGYWRMEVDNNAGAGFSIPNEVIGSALTGAAGSIEALNGGGIAFFPSLPNGGATNSFGLNGSPDINGTIAHYAALDASSITVEFFARTNEGDARFMLRQTGTTGLRIDQPNTLRVQYSTAAGQVTLTPGTNYDANWKHFAFTYDEFTGIGRVFIDGVQVAMNDGANNQALTWPALSSLLVGQAFDGGAPFSGDSNPIFDEIRIMDAAIASQYFLIGTTAIPEPATAGLLALGGMALLRRRCAAA